MNNTVAETKARIMALGESLAITTDPEDIAKICEQIEALGKSLVRS